jgi:hypothetical protein
MIYLLEGPDCGGKTTLATEIEDSLTRMYDVKPVRFRRGPLKQDPLLEYLVPLHDYDKRNDTWILDRWHLGETVYGPILRDESKITQAQVNYIELVLHTLGVVPVHVTASLTELHDRFNERGGDDIVSWTQIVTAWNAYNDMMPRYSHYEELDTTTKHPMTAAIQVTQQFKGRVAFMDNRRPDDYLGSLWPRVLLLGDTQGSHEQNDKSERPRLRWPFVPWKNTSGHWLFSAMNAAHINTRNIGLVNACDRTPEALSNLWMDIDTPPVVTLGINAKKAAMEAGLTITQHISHPSHARRFHHNNLSSYGDQIRECMK